MKKLSEMSRERKVAIRALLDPKNETIQDVAEVTGVHANTVIKYTSEDNFMKILLDAKKALKKSD